MRVDTFIEKIMIKLSSILVVAGALLTFHYALAQSFQSLNELKGHKAKVYFSSGADVKAKRMAERLDRVMSFYQKHLQFSPSVNLLILSPKDWSTFTTFPVYGMPHYSNEQALIVASEDNDFWRSFIPARDRMPAEYARLISETYSNNSGNISMEPFFDLLAVHELGHAYHLQGALTTQRKWMNELFCNIFLHTYVAENEPELLPALTTFPKMVVATTEKSKLRYTTLQELESNYNEVGQKYPQNYGWYQCRWHMAAGRIYDSGGLNAFVKLWSSLRQRKDVLDDAGLEKWLRENVHESVADVQKGWE